MLDFAEPWWCVDRVMAWLEGTAPGSRPHFTVPAEALKAIQHAAGQNVVRSSALREDGDRISIDPMAWCDRQLVSENGEWVVCTGAMYDEINNRSDAPYPGGVTWVDAEYDERLRRPEVWRRPRFLAYDVRELWPGAAKDASERKAPLIDRATGWAQEIDDRPEGVTKRAVAVMIAKREGVDISTVEREARRKRGNRGKAGTLPRP